MIQADLFEVRDNRFESIDLNMKSLLASFFILAAELPTATRSLTMSFCRPSYYKNMARSLLIDELANIDNNTTLSLRLTSLIIDIPLRSSTNRNNGIRTSLAIEGGGSNAISTLASTPGASSTLIDASLLYDHVSLYSFLSSHPLA